MTSNTLGQLRSSDDLLICNACGTQYAVTTGKDSCKICDDPRQFVPPEGQTFTTLTRLRQEGLRNVWWQEKSDPYIWSLRTEPEVSLPDHHVAVRAC